MDGKLSLPSLPDQLLRIKQRQPLLLSSLLHWLKKLVVGGAAASQQQQEVLEAGATEPVLVEQAEEQVPVLKSGAREEEAEGGACQSHLLSTRKSTFDRK